MEPDDELRSPLKACAGWPRAGAHGEALPGSLQVVDADHAWFGTTVDAVPLLETTSDGGHEWTSVRLPAIDSAPA
jgi:photosystem II stability/assembly factor-like uncharacterized protein